MRILNNCLYFELKVLMNCPLATNVDKITEAAKAGLLEEALKSATEERKRVLTNLNDRYTNLKKEIEQLTEVLTETLSACAQEKECKERFDQALSLFIERVKEEDLKLRFGASFGTMYRLEKVHLVHQRWNEVLKGKENFSSKEKRDFYLMQLKAQLKSQILKGLEEGKDLKMENGLLEGEIKQRELSNKTWLKLGGRLMTENILFRLGKELFLVGEKVLSLEEPYHTFFSNLAGVASFGLLATDLLFFQSLLYCLLSEPDHLLALGKALGHREEFILQNHFVFFVVTFGLIAFLRSENFVFFLTLQLLIKTFDLNAIQTALIVGSLIIGYQLFHHLFDPPETLLFNDALCLKEQSRCLKEAYEVFDQEVGTPFHQIKALYHLMAVKMHPDKNQGDEMIKLNAAYNIIKRFG